ncbi:hypothetical protein QE152_g20768 [Popillia japonica]|uniref:Transposase n=1 Tax=Popillia japonica TaxID=7064 RepID=A0AAW1KNH5_POPJA
MLTTQEEEHAVAMLQVSWAIKGVARELDVSHTSVWKLWQKWLTEQVVARRPGTGRVRITQPEQDNNLVRYIREHPFHTCRRAMGSQSTARNRLHQRNIRGYVPAIKR